MNRRHSLSLKIALTVVSLLVTVLFLEAAFRLIGFDFERKSAALKAIPVFYRIPTEPAGEVFFRRPGPDSWKGKVLSTGYAIVFGGKDYPYSQENEITVEYDKDGLRNPATLSDWDIVVVGDSCVELGYLPYEDLFSTRLGELLGVRVKNVGISYSGTVAETSYLKEYGKSTSTKQAVLVFFEGNDMTDIENETRELVNFKTTRKRSYREPKNQSSFLKAIYDTVGGLFVKPKSKDLSSHYGYYTFQDKETLVSLDYVPPARSELTSNQVSLVDGALAEWARTARTLGLKPWLVFMPCKRRVLDGHLKFTPGTDPKYVNWRPTDLPSLIKELSARNEMSFVDLTPALRKATDDGVLTYNPIWDTHLNRAGSEVVAHVIADAVKATAQPLPVR
jgi:hypothetical protein